VIIVIPHSVTPDKRVIILTPYFVSRTQQKSGRSDPILHYSHGTKEWSYIPIDPVQKRAVVHTHIMFENLCGAKNLEVADPVDFLENSVKFIKIQSNRV
jgi:hypothetical protein